MITLRVQFHGTFFCLAGNFATQAQTWLDNFGPGFSTGLLTLMTATPLIDPHGTLYVTAPDTVTPDTFGFLATNWSHDCIVVDTVSQVDSAPTAADEQKQVDTDNPGLAGGAANIGKSIVDAFTSFIADIFSILKTAGIVVGVLLVLVAGIALLHYQPWKYV